MTLLGQQVDVGTGAKKITWSVRENITKREAGEKVYEDYKDIGLIGFNADPASRANKNRLKGSRKMKQAKQKKDRVNLLILVQKLWPGNWCYQLDVLNARVAVENDTLEEAINKGDYDGQTKPTLTPKFSENEFWVFWGMLFASQVHGVDGKLWETKACESLKENVDLSPSMKKYRFEIMKRHIPFIWGRQDNKESDPWWRVSKLVNNYNNNRRRTIAASVWKVLDKSMSAYCPQTTAHGNLPNISHIKQKPEPLGTELKVVADAATGILLFLEIQRGKHPMRTKLYSNTTGVTTGYSMQLSEGAKQCGQQKSPA